VVMNQKMKYYSVDIQVDFEEPRVMPPGKGRERPLRAAGYFRYFYCSDRSKEKAKQQVLDFVRMDEVAPETCRFRCDRIAWMRWLTSIDAIGGGLMSSLTKEMYERRHEYGIWGDSGKQYYVSEADAAADWADRDEYEYEDEEDL